MIVLQQFDEFFDDIRQITVPHNETYCKKYNINYYCHINNDNNQINNQKYWNKILLAYKTLVDNKGDEWLLMLDGDAILLQEYDINIITRLISDNKDIGICRVTDKLAECFWNINVGVVFFRNTEFVKDILKDMINYANQKKYEPYEQEVFQGMLKQNYKNILEKTEIFSSTAFNHTGGPFIFHPCGKECTTTNKSIDAIKNKIIKLKQEIERIS